jgi:hypothetical protein
VPEDAPEGKTPLRPKGLFCPGCHGTRLFVDTVRRPCPGKVVRYMICSACDTVVITEEVLSKARRAKKPTQVRPPKAPPDLSRRSRPTS